MPLFCLRFHVAGDYLKSRASYGYSNVTFSLHFRNDNPRHATGRLSRRTDGATVTNSLRPYRLTVSLVPDYLLPASYVDMAVEFCHGTPDDRRKWLKIANRGINSFTGVLSEFEVDLKNPNMGRLRKPAAAFQARLNRVLPKV